MASRIVVVAVLLLSCHGVMGEDAPIAPAAPAPQDPAAAPVPVAAPAPASVPAADVAAPVSPPAVAPVGDTPAAAAAPADAAAAPPVPAPPADVAPVPVAAPAAPAVDAAAAVPAPAPPTQVADAAAAAAAAAAPAAAPAADAASPPAAAEPAPAAEKPVGDAQAAAVVDAAAAPVAAAAPTEGDAAARNTAVADAAAAAAVGSAPAEHAAEPAAPQHHEGNVIDDYYGDRGNDDYFGDVNIPAFQPSHFLTFTLQPNEVQTFYQHTGDEDISQLAQGNYFVLNGGDLTIDFKVTAPDGKIVHEVKSHGDDSFSFVVEQKGVYTVTLTNTASDSTRKLTLAWLVGKDTDRPVNVPGQDKALDPMFKAVARIHRRLDKVTSIMAFLDVRFSRNEETQISTQSRVALFSLVETGVLLGVTALQIWYIRRLVNNSASHLPGLR